MEAKPVTLEEKIQRVTREQSETQKPRQNYPLTFVWMERVEENQAKLKDYLIGIEKRVDEIAKALEIISISQTAILRMIKNPEPWGSS